MFGIFGDVQHPFIAQKWLKLREFRKKTAQGPQTKIYVKLINFECGPDTCNEVNLYFVPCVVFLGTYNPHLEPKNGLNYGNFVKNGGSTSKNRNY